MGLGVVAAQSKFQAVSLSFSQLLMVGQAQFGALHSITKVAYVVLLVLALLHTGWSRIWGVLASIAYAVAIFAVVPFLDDRMTRQILGEKLPPSSAHLVYVALLAVSLIGLAGAGWCASADAAKPSGEGFEPGAM